MKAEGLELPTSFRIPRHELALIDAAAEVVGQTRSQFVRGSSIEAARGVLAERRAAPAEEEE